MSILKILLSTYNGEKYLKQQLDSLLSQTYKNFEIIARDDGSQDKTLEILQSYNISIIDSKENLGAKGSFGALLEYAIQNSASDYFMFCDQDDVWHPEKISRTIEKMQQVEALYPHQAVLVHTDLSVVDRDLRMLHNSFWKYQNIDPTKDSLNGLILHNTVTGCTTMINRPLAQIVKNIPQEAIMHDWWISLTASAFGRIGYVDKPLMFYRQHGANDTGAKNYGWKHIIDRFLSRPKLDKYIIQANAFYTLFSDQMTIEQRKIFEDLSHWDNLGFWAKRRLIIKHRLWKNGAIRNIGLMVFA